MDLKDWRKRIVKRNDMVVRVTHLTKGQSNDEAFERLWKILVDKKLNGGNGYVSGDRKVVCFQDIPLNALAENLMYEKALDDKVRYSPFGIRFSKPFIYQKGGRPVIYENSKKMKLLLPSTEYWRIVDFNLDNRESCIDWSHEREWRVPDELVFDYKDVEVIVKNEKYYRMFVQRCIEKERTDILTKICGITTLVSVYA